MKDRVSNGIAWRETGDGEAVVFLHGLGGSRTAWDPQLASLGQTFRCVAWDMPGYGASEPHESLSYESIAESVIALLDELEVDVAHLVGESFGGMHALHTAIAFPNRVGRMALTNTSPAFGMDGTDPQEWKQNRLGPLDKGQIPADFAEKVLSAIAGPLLVGDAMAARVAAFARISGPALRASIECLPHNDVRAQLGSIDCPTLVIAGELDEETPVSYATALADGLADSELVVLSGVGHLAASEAPGKFNQLLVDFLSQ